MKLLLILFISVVIFNILSFGFSLRITRHLQGQTSERNRSFLELTEQSEASGMSGSSEIEAITARIQKEVENYAKEKALKNKNKKNIPGLGVTNTDTENSNEADMMNADMEDMNSTSNVNAKLNSFITE